MFKMKLDLISGVRVVNNCGNIYTVDCIELT
jgi:hypothetical protein